jgi:hypothetical protein
MIAQLQTEAMTKRIMTTFTIISACMNKPIMVMSWA